MFCLGQRRNNSDFVCRVAVGLELPARDVAEDDAVALRKGQHALPLATALCQLQVALERIDHFLGVMPRLLEGVVDRLQLAGEHDLPQWSCGRRWRQAKV